MENYGKFRSLENFRNDCLEIFLAQNKTSNLAPINLHPKHSIVNN